MVEKLGKANIALVGPTVPGDKAWVAQARRVIG